MGPTLIDDVDLCTLAFENDMRSLKFVKEKVLEDEDFCFNCVRADGLCL